EARGVREVCWGEEGSGGATISPRKKKNPNKKKIGLGGGAPRVWGRRAAGGAAAPPVASRSSTSTICSPAVMASMCISISASPYSSEYFAISVLYGNLPRFRIGTKPTPSS